MLLTPHAIEVLTSSHRREIERLLRPTDPIENYRPVHAARAREVPCDRKAATRAWERGYDNRGIPSIKSVLMVEREQREKVQDEQLAADELRRRALQRQANITAEERELKEKGLSRGALDVAFHGALPVIMDVWQSARQLGVELKARMTPTKDDPRPASHMKTNEIGRALRDAALMTKAFSDVVHDVMEIERLRVGKPTSIVGIADPDVMPRTLEEYENIVAACAADIERMREHGADLPANAAPAALPAGARAASDAELDEMVTTAKRWAPRDRN